MSLTREGSSGSYAHEDVSGPVSLARAGHDAAFTAALPVFGDDLLSLGMRADRARRQMHPERVVTYTNTARVVVGAGSAQEAVLASARAACELGAHGIELEFAPAHLPSPASASGLLRRLRECFPALTIAGCSAAGAATMAAREGLAVDELLRRLQAAGLDSLAPEESIASEADWLRVQHAAHRLGMQTTAVLPVAPSGTADQRLRWLEAIDRLQEETGGFCSLAVTAPSPRRMYLSDELTAVEFLTALATARLALPKVPHIESNWAAQGLKLLQMTLRFGADDAGSTLLDRTIAYPGPDTPTEEDLRRVIRDAGFAPVERSGRYTSCYLP